MKDEDDTHLLPESFPDPSMSDDEKVEALKKALDELVRFEEQRRGKVEPAVEPYAKAPNLSIESITHAPFEMPPIVRIRRDADTENLLNGLIAECHFLMRVVAVPSSLALNERVRRDFLASAMDLAKTGAIVGKSVAKLRAAGKITELRQTHTVEHVGRVLSPPSPLAEKK